MEDLAATASCLAIQRNTCDFSSITARNSRDGILIAVALSILVFLVAGAAMSYVTHRHNLQQHQLHHGVTSPLLSERHSPVAQSINTNYGADMQRYGHRPLSTSADEDGDLAPQYTATTPLPYGKTSRRRAGVYDSFDSEADSERSSKY